MDQTNAGSSSTRPNLAPSIHSSRMTDAASEDADEYLPEGPASKASKDATGKKSLTSSNRPSSPPQSFYSRRGSTRRRGFGGPGHSMANSSRVENLYNRNSMTHAPSITSHAFFRPMSSQRLQAQRTARPNTGTQESTRLSSPTMDRPSIESNNTNTPATPARREHTAPPSSHGTDMTDADPRDRTIYNASPTGNGTIQSGNESTRPLQRDIEALPNGVFEEKEASTFRSNFLRSNGHSPSAQQHFNDNEKYSDDAQSPHLRDKFPADAYTGKRNYQYFPGNTIFLGWGRFQNTRERPINLFTAVATLFPIVAFLVTG